MGLRPNEISALIKEQIKHYDDIIEQKDVGTVVTVGDGVSVIHGLDNAMLGELLLFPNDVYGMVMNLDEDSVGAVLLGSESTIKEGDEVKRTGRIIEVPVGDEMLGRVVNPLGQAIDGQGEINTGKTKPIERVASGVMTRKSVDQPLQTGITSIDAIIPIGRGQRELIIGDRQTGKTAIAIDTILNQKGQNIYCVYVAIGQKNSTVAQVVEKLRQGGAMDYTCVVSAGASELAPIQYIAPYAGCAIAEHWLDEGKDVTTKTEITYNDVSQRPDKIIVTVIADEKGTIYKFDNNLDNSLKNETPENEKEIIQDRLNETNGTISSIKEEYDKENNLVETTVYITYKNEDGTNYRTSVIIEN